MVRPESNRTHSLTHLLRWAPRPRKSVCQQGPIGSWAASAGEVRTNVTLTSLQHHPRQTPVWYRWVARGFISVAKGTEPPPQVDPPPLKTGGAADRNTLVLPGLLSTNIHSASNPRGPRRFIGSANPQLSRARKAKTHRVTRHVIAPEGTPE